MEYDSQSKGRIQAMYQSGNTSEPNFKYKADACISKVPEQMTESWKIE